MLENILQIREMLVRATEINAILTATLAVYGIAYWGYQGIKSDLREGKRVSKS